MATDAGLRVCFVFSMGALVASCSGEIPQETEEKIEFSDGVIANVNGEVRKLSAEEESALCENQYCEPNYLYSIDFGRRRPRPDPEPTPTPTPTPTPPPIDYTDKLDYSREILRVAEAWELTEGSEEVVVAVVDTGVESTHPDLEDNMWVNTLELLGERGVDDDGNGFVDDVNGWDFYNNRPNGVDDNKHGTHCAGIVAGALNNVGMAGVAPRVKVMSLKFLSRWGSGSTDNAVKAIDYAVANGAHVISNSWGGGSYSQFLDEAIQRAHEAGVFVVAAAGNSSANNDTGSKYPANYANVIAVASTDENDDLSSFSNYGRTKVMVAAPGTKIYSAVLDGKWDELSGTSMATPQVSGALALALSLKPDLDVESAKDALCSSSKKILLDQVKCGRMDVFELLNSL